MAQHKKHLAVGKKGQVNADYAKSRFLAYSTFKVNCTECCKPGAEAVTVSV
jgi:hypothetical protein